MMFNGVELIEGNTYYCEFTSFIGNQKVCALYRYKFHSLSGRAATSYSYRIYFKNNAGFGSYNIGTDSYMCIDSQIAKLRQANENEIALLNSFISRGGYEL